MSCRLCQAENFLPASGGKKKYKKGFFFFLWAGESSRKVEIRAWEWRVVFAQREAGCVLTIPSVAVIDPWGFSSPLQGASPGRGGNEPLAIQADHCARV